MDLSHSSRCLLLAILAWGLCAWGGSGVGWASCGDYVQLGGAHSALSGTMAGYLDHPAARMMHLAAHSGFAFVDGDRVAGKSAIHTKDKPVEVPVPAPSGCSGPTCRGALPPAPGSGSVAADPVRLDGIPTTALAETGEGEGLRAQGVWGMTVAGRLREGRWERPPRGTVHTAGWNGPDFRWPTAASC